jgi:hypothetical protein
MHNDLSSDFVRSLFSYDEVTGELRWARRIYSRGYVGTVAGGINVPGYRVIKILGKTYRAQRIIWLIKTGNWPLFFIDHINGIKTDNRWSNLRQVTNALNTQNRTKANADNVVGLLGVRKRLDKRTRPFYACIDVGNKTHSLGSFVTAEEAHAAYLIAKKKFHPGYVEASPYERSS